MLGYHKPCVMRVIAHGISVLTVCEIYEMRSSREHFVLMSDIISLFNYIYINSYVTYRCPINYVMIISNLFKGNHFQTIYMGIVP
jgi:hypothetical protein